MARPLGLFLRRACIGVRGQNASSRRAALLVLLSICAMRTFTPAAELYIDPQFTVVETPDFVYGTGAIGNPQSGELNLRLDVYQPTGPGVPDLTPVVIIAHGGGLNSGTKQGFRADEMAHELVERGYGFVSINYRRTRDDPTLESGIADDWVGTPDSLGVSAANPAISDFDKAVRWVLGNAHQFGFDRHRVAVGGYSAGAIIALPIAFEERGFDGNIRAVIDQWGAMYGTESLIDADDPHLLIWHGENDRRVPITWSEDVVNQAQAVGLPVLFNAVPNQGHGLEPTLWHDLIDNELVPWLLDHLALQPRVTGDANWDDLVNNDDYTVLANQFEASGLGISGDFSGDGTVGPEDYTLWANGFDASLAASAVPEPGSWVLMLAGCIGGGLLMPRGYRRRERASRSLAQP